MPQGIPPKASSPVEQAKLAVCNQKSIVGEHETGRPEVSEHSLERQPLIPDIAIVKADQLHQSVHGA